MARVLSSLLLAAALSLYRMLAAYVVSLVISIFLGVAMARSRRFEAVMLPVLDVLQSIPILGFFPAALAVFVNSLGPAVGGELSAIFLIVTSLVWNMIFGVYSSIKSLDPAIEDLSKVYRLPLSLRFFAIYVPASRSALVSNSIISWAGGWFFLTSAEVISLGSQSIKLVGLGSFIVDASSRGDWASMWAGVLTLFFIIIATYVLLWNPAASKYARAAVALPGFAALYDLLDRTVASLWRWLARGLARLLGQHPLAAAALPALGCLGATRLVPLGLGLAGILARYGLEFLGSFYLTLARVYLVLGVGLALTIGLAYIASTRRRLGSAIALAGELASSIPAILWWPMLWPLVGVAPWFVSFFVFLQGSLWYTFFNVMIFGLSSLREELLELARVYNVRGWLYVKSLFVPALLPSMLAGLLSASGGAWNASIAAEYISVGGLNVDMGGVGSLLNKLSSAGDYAGVLAVAIYWSLLIATINRALWKRLFEKLGGRFVVE